MATVVVGGVHARKSGDRYSVSIAVVDDDRVVDHSVVPAPAGEAASRQLRELQVRAHELLRSTLAEALVLWQLDPPPRAGSVRLLPTLTIGRAEGAVLVAAGQLGIETVATVSGPTVRAAAGGSATDDAVEALCSGVKDAPSTASVRRAIAAARAWLIRGGS